MQLYTDSLHTYCNLHQSKRGLPYLFMLHGFMGSGNVFDHLLEELSVFCNPITIDLAGHGKTESPEDSSFYTTDRQVEQLCSIVQRLQFDDLYLYGYSMGGRLALQLIAAYPDLFTGGIIESSHCGITSKKKRGDRQKMDKKRAKQIEQNFEEFIDEWMTLPLFKHTPDEMKSVYKKVTKAQNPKQMSASLRGFGAGIMPVIYDKIIPLNLTLIAGELDQKYVEKMTSIHKSMDNSKLQIVKNAGHRVHADQPEKLINILRNTMRQN